MALIVHGTRDTETNMATNRIYGGKSKVLTAIKKRRKQPKPVASKTPRSLSIARK